MKKKAAQDRALEMMRWSISPPPAFSAASYPHEMSGGMAQHDDRYGTGLPSLRR